MGNQLLEELKDAPSQATLTEEPHNLLRKHNHKCSRRICEYYMITNVDVKKTLKKAVFGKYQECVRRCMMCETWLHYHGSRCPCCHFMLRTRRHQKTVKKRRADQKKKMAVGDFVIVTPEMFASKEQLSESFKKNGYDQIPVVAPLIKQG